MAGTIPNIKFRFANAADIDLYFNWINDELVRENSFEKDKITYENHLKWFHSKINSPHFHFYLFLDREDKPIGQVRIEKRSNETIISISIDKKHRGKSYGAEMIKQATEDFLQKNKKDVLSAYIKVGNVPSLKIFEKAGFLNKIAAIAHNSDSIKLTKSNNNFKALCCAIMQPIYLPWLGYFDLIRNSDVFVILDHVQFQKQSWQQRNRIRNRNGEILLTIPVHYEHGLQRKINEVRIDNSRNSQIKHLKSIYYSYSKATSFKYLYRDLELAYQAKYNYILELNMRLITIGMNYLGINKKILFSSQMDVQGKRVDGLIEICSKVGANKYLSPIGSKVYINENNIFNDYNIKLEYQQFIHPIYNQMNQSNFIPKLAFIDYLLNVNLEESSVFGSLKEYNQPHAK